MYGPLLCAATALTLIALNLRLCHTTPRAIARQVRRHPGATLLIGVFNGTCAALACWVIGMFLAHSPYRTGPSRLFLAVIAGTWLLLHLIWETAGASQARHAAGRRAIPKPVAATRHRPRPLPDPTWTERTQEIPIVASWEQ